ncbi:MAG TPA: diaminopimelate decarboxylase [Thermoleophilia bacterium]|nr:diaminopimelate decarboxylase [Thermoleophilia bacterium]
MGPPEESAGAAPTVAGRPWWEHAGLRAVDGRLRIAGRDAETLAREHGTPLYVYDLTRIDENVSALHDALAATGVPFRIRAALKAQREPEALARFRAFGPPGSAQAVGLDVCSPGEVEHGLAHGFLPSEISYTGTNVSERDLDVILRHGVHANLDLLSQIHRYGRRAPGTAVGLRVNPRISAVDPDNATHAYSGDRPTKFGVYPERLEEAVAVARSYALTVDTVHVHLAHELRTSLLPRFEEATAAVAAIARRLLDLGCPVTEVNMGGGLSAPTTDVDDGLDLAAYAAVLARHLGPLGMTVGVEPGEYFSTDAAVLLAEVVTVEDRSAAGDGGAVFAGLDCGWNIMNAAFVYHEPTGVVLCRAADAPAERRYTVTGHINEGPDIFAEEAWLPALDEGDIVALPCVGAYCQANWHTHCLRPFPGVLYFDDRLPA